MENGSQEFTLFLLAKAIKLFLEREYFWFNVSINTMKAIIFVANHDENKCILTYSYPMYHSENDCKYSQLFS